MQSRKGVPLILVIDDDRDDQKLLQDAMQEIGWEVELHFIEDVDELSTYLFHNGQREESRDARLPDLIVTDLALPKKSGYEVLAEIKADSLLRTIPVVVLTGSWQQEDIRRCYALGASSFIAKPCSFGELVQIVTALRDYWFKVAVLPCVPDFRHSCDMHRILVDVERNR